MFHFTVHLYNDLALLSHRFAFSEMNYGCDRYISGFNLEVTEPMLNSVFDCNDDCWCNPGKIRKFADYQQNLTNTEDERQSWVQLIFASLIPQPQYESVASKYLNIQMELSKSLSDLPIQNVDTVYNPLDYGYSAHAEFVRAYLDGPKRILFLGMNPGPYGMCQTAIPFGDVGMVRDFLKITTSVTKPQKQSAMKQILGFECRRSERSGKKFWGYFKSLCGYPHNFFKHAFVRNFIPLAFLRGNYNVTPIEMKKDPALKVLEKRSSDALIQVVDLLQVETIIALGRYTEVKVKSVLKQSGKQYVNVVYLMHPSPRNCKETKWEDKVDTCLTENGLVRYFQ